MATVIDSETKFQKNWLEPKLRAAGHFMDHRFSHMPDVPDVSCAAHGVDYWLELKYGEFKLLHTKYDRLEFETTRGQLSFLEQRAKHGRAICGVLAYIVVSGDLLIPFTDRQVYLFFMTAKTYLRKVWKTDYDVGAAILSQHTRALADVLTGRDLLRFIHEASADGL